MKFKKGKRISEDKYNQKESTAYCLNIKWQTYNKANLRSKLYIRHIVCTKGMNSSVTDVVFSQYKQSIRIYHNNYYFLLLETIFSSRLCAPLSVSDSRQVYLDSGALILTWSKYGTVNLIFVFCLVQMIKVCSTHCQPYTWLSFKPPILFPRSQILVLAFQVALISSSPGFWKLLLQSFIWTSPTHSFLFQVIKCVSESWHF